MRVEAGFPTFAAGRILCQTYHPPRPKATATMMPSIAWNHGPRVFQFSPMTTPTQVRNADQINEPRKVSTVNLIMGTLINPHGRETTVRTPGRRRLPKTTASS